MLRIHPPFQLVAIMHQLVICHLPTKPYKKKNTWFLAAQFLMESHKKGTEEDPFNWSTFR